MALHRIDKVVEQEARSIMTSFVMYLAIFPAMKREHTSKGHCRLGILVSKGAQPTVHSVPCNVMQNMCNS